MESVLQKPRIYPTNIFFGILSANMEKLSVNMASAWNCKFQHSGVSAGLGGILSFKTETCIYDAECVASLWRGMRSIPLTWKAFPPSFQTLAVRNSAYTTISFITGSKALIMHHTYCPLPTIYIYIKNNNNNSLKNAFLYKHEHSARILNFT